MILNSIVKSIKRKSHRGNQNVTTDQITLDIIACVNETAREVQRLVPKRFWWKKDNIDVAAGTAGTPATFALPTDCQEPSLLYYVHENAFYLIKKMDSDREWISQIWNPVMGTQRPMWFRELGPDVDGKKQFEIFPIPDQEYLLTLEYYRVKGDEYTTTDLPNEITNIPDYVQDVLEKGGLYKFLKQFDDNGAVAAKLDYDKAILDFNNADEADMDGELRIRLGTVRFELPGFRLT